MIRIQPTSARSDSVLVGSDLSDPREARCEVEAWADENDFVIGRNNRPLCVFEHGILVREWVLAQGRRPADPSDPTDSYRASSSSSRPLPWHPSYRPDRAA